MKEEQKYLEELQELKLFSELYQFIAETGTDSLDVLPSAT